MLSKKESFFLSMCNKYIVRILYILFFAGKRMTIMLRNNFGQNKSELADESLHTVWYTRLNAWICSFDCALMQSPFIYIYAWTVSWVFSYNVTTDCDENVSSYVCQRPSYLSSRVLAAAWGKNVEVQCQNNRCIAYYSNQCGCVTWKDPIYTFNEHYCRRYSMLKLYFICT